MYKLGEYTIDINGKLIQSGFPANDIYIRCSIENLFITAKSVDLLENENLEEFIRSYNGMVLIDINGSHAIFKSSDFNNSNVSLSAFLDQKFNDAFCVVSDNSVRGLFYKRIPTKSEQKSKALFNNNDLNNDKIADDYPLTEFSDSGVGAGYPGEADQVGLVPGGK